MVPWFREIVTTSMLPGSSGNPTTQYNCYGNNKGASYAPDCISTVDPPHCDKVELADCFELCEKDSKCDAITVNWDFKSCYLRGGIDLSKCDHASNNFDYGTFSTLSMATLKKTPLTIALHSAGGYLSAIEWTGSNIFWDSIFWSGASGSQPLNFPGDGSLGKFRAALWDSKAFSMMSLLTPLTVKKSSHYAFLRYNALEDLLTSDDAPVGVAVFNLGSKADTVNVGGVDISEKIVGGSLKDIISGEPVANLSAVQVPAYGWRLMDGWTLPSWKRHDHLNCYTGHGATYSPGASFSSTSIAECFLTCLMDGQCSAVTVQWLPYGKVGCWKRGGVTYSQCQTDNAYSTFSVNGRALSGRAR